MNETNGIRCNRVRELLADILDDTTESTSSALSRSTIEVDGEPINVHLENCIACQIWKTQTDQIIDMTRTLPQFDVSENLTQSILTQVSAAEKTQHQQLAWLVYAMAICTFLYIMLFVDAFESFWGLGSWLLGLATMIGLNLLIREPKKERQPV